MSANENAPTGYATWVGWIESSEKSADRYGDMEVVPASLARQLAARLDESHKLLKTLIESLLLEDQRPKHGEK
jgi:hypothetical protein